jgi:hypothetical protein
VAVVLRRVVVVTRYALSWCRSADSHPGSLIVPTWPIFALADGLAHGWRDSDRYKAVVVEPEAGNYIAVVSTTADPLKIPDWLPTASQALRLRVAGGALRPRKPIDSGDCGEKTEGSPPSAVLLWRTGRQNEEKRRGN